MLFPICQMAKAMVEDGEDQSFPDKVKVTPRSNPPLFTPSTPSDEYLDAKHSYEDDDLDDPMIAKLNKFMCSLKGKKLTMFHMLTEMVGKHTFTIKELETLITEEKEKYEILERKVQYEEARNDELCLKIGANIDVHTKDLSSLKKAIDSC